MQININSVHFKTDGKLENFIREKVKKVAKFHDGIIGGDVALKVVNTEKPENKIVEIRLKVKGNDLISSKQGKTFEEATDLAINALRIQAKKTKKVGNRADKAETKRTLPLQETDLELEDSEEIEDFDE
ncbi:MAG: HPF/RaiA family ribosome-associated protein [Lentimicrobiaceae bacterium]|nr:HPF/RaiA family ribosome-associated protein [Lentimicrobiaceae bacterium]